MKLSHARLLWIVLSAALAGLFLPCAAQTPPSRASLQGIVAKSPSGEPVKKAIIELIAESQDEGGNYTAQTGADGVFRIEGIAPGRYHLFVERPGYLETDKHHSRTEGRVLTLAAGQEIKDLVIRLQPAAVIEGRVTDEDGEPLPEAQVSVLRQTFLSGHAHWEQAGAERTNDLGEYRIANLAAGNYYVSVAPPPDFKSLIEATSKAEPHNAPSDKPAPTSYQTTYYPGTHDRAQAAPVQLHAGDDFPVSFSLTPSPTLTIRGSVTNLARGATANIMLQSRDFSLVLNLAEVHKDGSFEIRDVSPGTYTILATVDTGSAPLLARQTLRVTSANIDGLRLAPQPGALVRGRLRLESKAAARLNPTQIFLELRPAEEDDALSSFTMAGNFSTVAQVRDDGSFEWKNVPPGRYFVQLSGEVSSDQFLKSVEGGAHAPADADFSVNGGAVDLDVVVSADGAVADGVVTARKGEPVANATVVAVPEARYRKRLDRFRKTLTDQAGRFTLRGLPPGDYTLFAWESMDGEAYFNPEFVRNYEGQGNPLHVGEGEHRSVPLEVIPAADDAGDGNQP